MLEEEMREVKEGGIKSFERLNVESVSIRSRNGAPSRKRRVVNGHTTKASNKLARPPHTKARFDLTAVCWP